MDTRVRPSLRRLAALSFLLLLLISCGLPLPQPPATPTPAPPLPTATPLPPPTSTPLPTRTPVPTPRPGDLYLAPDSIRLYPVPHPYSGDQVTFDVTPHNLGEINPYDLTVRISHQSPSGEGVIAEGRVGYPTFDRTPRARFVWAWDTTGLEGEQTLTIHLDPEDEVEEGDEDPTNNVVTLTVPLLPAEERPTIEVGATWATSTTECCILHYMTGTAAERDLPQLAARAEEGVEHVQAQLDARLPEPFNIYFIGRVIGHGGYAHHGLTLSYLDRSYAGQDMETVIRHEAAHVLDLDMLTGWSPALVREGLAVWVAGGHFKPEPIPQRAAALLELDWYIPLAELSDDFYRQQHEIGYLEGAAFVSYLVETYGWDGFRRFYTSFDASYDTPTQILDAALSETFGVSFEEAEEAFLHWLEDHPPTSDQVRDLENTVYLFDTIRSYQDRYDPSAYFLIGFIPDPSVGAERGIVADFLRHPRSVENVTLEAMLIDAQRALRMGAFDRVEYLLDGVNQVLEEGSFSSKPTREYLTIVETVASTGYEVQQIEMEEETARVWAIDVWPTLIPLTLHRTSSGWVIE